MNIAWVLIITFHIGYGDQGVTSIPFANQQGCEAAAKAIKEMQKMYQDYFACVDQTTGSVIVK